MENAEGKNKYEVALSFAGEQRAYVEKVASVLRENGISVYYDQYDQVGMWGKNMVDHFENIYGKDAQYVVMFISKEYAEKAWTNHERQVILARKLYDDGFLLPVKFDATKINGLPGTVAYLDLRKISESDLASKILQKVGHGNTQKTSKENLGFDLPKIAPKVHPYKERSTFIDFVTKELEKRCSHIPELDFFAEDLGGKRQIRIQYNDETIYALDMHRGGVSSEKGISFTLGGGSGYHAWGDFKWSRENNCVVLKISNLSLFDSNSMMSEGDITYGVFVDHAWKQVVHRIEELSR